MKPANGLVITDELREELDHAAVATQQAYMAVRAAPGVNFTINLLGEGESLREIVCH